MVRQLGRKLVLTAAAGGLVIYGCAPQPYRSPVPPSATLPRAPQTTAPVPPSPPQEIARRPVPPDSKIIEQDIKSKAPPTAPAGKDSKDTSKQASIGDGRTSPDSSVSQPTPPPLPDDSSLL